MSQLLFFAADTLGVTLYQMDGLFKGHERRTIKLGPWKVPIEITVTSDLITPLSVSFWMTLQDTLPCYVVVKEKHSYIIVLDKPKLQEAGAATSFASTTLAGRFHEIKPALTAVFQWTAPDKWVKVDYNQATMEG